MNRVLLKPSRSDDAHTRQATYQPSLTVPLTIDRTRRLFIASSITLICRDERNNTNGEEMAGWLTRRETRRDASGWIRQGSRCVGPKDGPGEANGVHGVMRRIA